MCLFGAWGWAALYLRFPTQAEESTLARRLASGRLACGLRWPIEDPRELVQYSDAQYALLRREIGRQSAAPLQASVLHTASQIIFGQPLKSRIVACAHPIC